MTYDFKKIADLERVIEVPEGANLLIETEGATKRLPSTAINNGYAKDEVYNKTETYSKEEVYTKEECDEKYLTAENVSIGADLIFNGPEMMSGSAQNIVNETTVIGSLETVMTKMANGELPNIYFRGNITNGDYRIWNVCPLSNIYVYGNAATFSFVHPQIGNMSYIMIVYSDGQGYIDSFTSDSHNQPS